MRLVDELACHSLVSAFFAPRCCMLSLLKVYPEQ